MTKMLFVSSKSRRFNLLYVSIEKYSVFRVSFSDLLFFSSILKRDIHLEMNYFALIVVAFIPFSIILANDDPIEPICEDILGTEICSNMKRFFTQILGKMACDQLKYKKECAKTCLQCWSDDYWYVHKYLNHDQHSTTISNSKY